VHVAPKRCLLPYLYAIAPGPGRAELPSGGGRMPIGLETVSAYDPNEVVD